MMAAKGSKNSTDNLEKMKSDKTSKRKTTKKQNDVEALMISDNRSINNYTEENGKDLTEDTKKDLADDANKTEMVTFLIGEEEYALEISSVKEIIRLPQFTKVPNAPAFIMGLCNLRGELLPVIDSRKLFNLAALDYNEGARVVIIDIKGKKLGLIVDKVSEVLSVDLDIVKEPPESLKGIGGGVIKNILLPDHGKRVIMVLDAPKLVKIENYAEYAGQVHNSAASSFGKVLQEEEQAIVFNIGKEEYAFSVNDVKEIIRMPELIKVPNTPDHVEGVFSIRNELIAVVNLGTMLNVTNKQADENSRVIIVDNGTVKFGVIVDKVSQVIRLQKESLKISRHGKDASNKDYIKGFLEFDQGRRLIILLNACNLISIEEVNNIVLKKKSNKKGKRSLSENTDAQSDTEHIVVFKVGDNEFGIRINHVKEINRISDMVHFPGAPAFIDGMVNLRGEAIPVLNLNKMFYDDQSSSVSSKFLDVEYEHKRIGIMIDSASEVLRIQKSNLEKVTAILDKDIDYKYVEAIIKLDGGKRMVLLLNLSFILNFM